MDKLFDTSLITQFDFVILAIIGLSAIFAFLNGFVRSAISFSGAVVAFILSIRLSSIFSALFSNYVVSQSVAIIVTTIVLFILFLIIMSSISSIISTFVSPLCGGLIDRSLGIFFGVIRGCILVAFGFYMTLFAMPELDVRDKSDIFTDNLKLPKWARNSETLLLLSKGANFISNMMPEGFSQNLHKSMMESKNDDGDFSISSDKIDNIRSLNKIFSMLPEQFLDTIPQKDLVTLQDHMAPASSKVRILEGISNKYQKYINSKKYYGRDLDRVNKRFHEVMSAIEDEIHNYNSMIEH